jgi:hypothetical protein
MPDADMLLRELNHRVNNNFQVIVSLMNLKKRMLPPDRREDIRFIQEHVQCMSAAFRLVYATGNMVDVPLSELIADVTSGLREIAHLSNDQVRVDTAAGDAAIGLDQAIALALYMAVILPPYLDRAAATHATVRVAARVDAGIIAVSLSGTWTEPIALDYLRSQLMRAYVGQLQAELLPPEAQTGQLLRFALDPPRLRAGRS